MNDLRDWTLVGTVDRSTGNPLSYGSEYTNLFMVPAIFRRSPRGGISVTIFWQTSDESFIIRPDGDMAYQDGDEVLVLVSTETSSRLGYANGDAMIEAIQTSPGTWCRNRN